MRVVHIFYYFCVCSWKITDEPTWRSCPWVQTHVLRIYTVSPILILIGYNWGPATKGCSVECSCSGFVPFPRILHSIAPQQQSASILWLLSTAQPSVRVTPHLAFFSFFKKCCSANLGIPLSLLLATVPLVCFGYTRIIYQSENVCVSVSVGFFYSAFLTHKQRGTQKHQGGGMKYIKLYQ